MLQTEPEEAMGTAAEDDVVDDAEFEDAAKDEMSSQDCVKAAEEARLAKKRADIEAKAEPRPATEMDRVKAKFGEEKWAAMSSKQRKLAMLAELDSDSEHEAPEEGRDVREAVLSLSAPQCMAAADGHKNERQRNQAGQTWPVRMASTTEDPPESVPPQKRSTSTTKDPAKRVEREVVPKEAWQRKYRECKQQLKVVVALGVVCSLLVVLTSYLRGCGACKNDAECDALFGKCICTGNHVGEFCEDSCGEFGQVNDGACVCSSNYTGAFCDVPPDFNSDLHSDSTSYGVGSILVIVCTCSTHVGLSFSAASEARHRNWRHCNDIVTGLVCLDVVCSLPVVIILYLDFNFSLGSAATIVSAALGCALAMCACVKHAYTDDEERASLGEFLSWPGGFMT